MSKRWMIVLAYACAHLFMCVGACGQTVGKLRLIVDPGNDFQFVLDHQYRMQQRDVELAPGPHHFTFWAPERSMVDTTLIVVAGQTRDVLIRLPYSPAYRAYEQEMREMKKREWFTMVLPAAATLGTGILAYSTFTKYKNAHETLDADEDFYRSNADPAQLADLKAEVIPRHKSEFKDKRDLFYVTAGVFAVVAAGSAYIMIRSSKREAPKFHDSERVKFDGLVWLPSAEGGMLLTGIHWNLR